MELLAFTDDILKQILPHSFVCWEDWYRLLFVCKRFKALLYPLRQMMLETCIEWVSPESDPECFACQGELTDHCLTFTKIDHWTSEERPTDSDDEFDEEGITYCSYECAVSDNTCYPCCDCGEDVLSADIHAVRREMVCITCDPDAFNELMPVRKHLLKKKWNVKEVKRRLKRCNGYAPNCNVCGKENKTRSIVVRGGPANDNPCILIPLGIVCSYECYLNFKSEGNIYDTFQVSNSLWH